MKRKPQLKSLSTWILVATTMLFMVLLGVGCDPELPPNKSCLTDEQCDVGEFHCVNRVCVVLTPCRTNQQCDAPQFQCVDQRCRRSPLCNSDNDCSNPNQFCSQNYCVGVQPKNETAGLYVTFDQTPASPEKVQDTSISKHLGQWSQQGKITEESYRGKAASFDGTMSYIKFPYHKDFARKHITVEAWVRVKDPKKPAFVVSFCDETCRNGYGLRINEKGQVIFQISTASDTFSCTGTTSIHAGTWVHLTGSYDGQKIRCFVNGKLDSSTDWNGEPTYLQSDLIIGGRTDQQYMFHGDMDEVALTVGGQTLDFSPGLTRYLYVADKDGKLLSIDSTIDRVKAGQSLSAIDNKGWPVALSHNGKYLYLWSTYREELTVIDIATSKVKATVVAKDAGLPKGALATISHTSRTLWLWGKTTYVYALPLTDNAKPVATFEGLGASFGHDVAWLPQRNVFAVSDPEGKKLHHFDATQPAQLKAHSFENNQIDGEKPTALAVNPVSNVLYVSFQDSNELQLLSMKDDTYTIFGSLTTKERKPDGSELMRQVGRMVAHPRGEHLYYLFEKPGYIYRLDTKSSLQHLLWEGTDKKEIPKLTSSYFMHLHHLGDKLYLQDKNSGNFHVLGTQSHKIEKTFKLGIETADAKLPIVGVTNRRGSY